MEIIINLMGGLGLFLYGMNLMGDGLQKSAGAKLKRIIELLTSNVIMGVLVGMVVTMVIQSSSATTVMVVGFVNAGIMSLTQAIGVIMGANIGTTITAQLVSLDVDFLAPVALGIGIVIYMFSNKPKHKNIAEILIGFGILFTGMDFMKEAVKPLAGYQGFTDMLLSFGHHPILGVLMGFAITAIVQSSSASMGMLLALASEGLIPLSSALPILYGENIGTCVTSLISSIGASKNARRAATMHLVFNIIGTLVFMFLLTKPITMLVTHLDPNDVSRQIANSHTLFNVINVILLLPFSKLIVKLTMKLVPEGEDEVEDTKVVRFIDERMITTPSIALSNTSKETLRMGNKAKASLENAMNGLLEKSEAKVKYVFEEEAKINKLQKTILDYLLKLSKTSLNHDCIEGIDKLFNTINDIERVGDHAINIAQRAKKLYDDNERFSDEALKEIGIMNNLTKNILEELNVLDKEELHNIVEKVDVIENSIDITTHEFAVNQLNRLRDKKCTVEHSALYTETLIDFERIGDHGLNIAVAFNEIKDDLTKMA